MNYLTNRSLLYIIIVIFPIFFITGYYTIELYHNDKLERNQDAQRIARIHEENWNNFIEQTVTILDMLSMSISAVQETPDKMEYLLNKGTQSDPRYAGMFLLDSSGNVINGDRSLLLETNLSKESFIQEVFRTKDIIISDKSAILVNGQKVIGIARPVLDANQNLNYIIVAYFKADYIKNLIRTTFPTEHYRITNSKNETIMEINAALNSDTKNIYTISIDRIPWEIHVSIPKSYHTKLQTMIIQFCILMVILFHSFFFVVNYFIQQKKAEKEKKQNDLQKLELIGTLAASLAHEIRNPLTGIKGLIQLLGETHTDEKDQKYFSVIGQEINRINEIVSEFLILGKPSAVKTDLIDLRDIITELIPLIDYEAKRNQHHLSIILPDDPIYIKGSKDQMKQVVLNITKNAIEAMKEKGIITIMLEVVENKAQLSISDTGQGISPKQMKRIFNPFYTSKETGTGLGLVICKRIIESNDGHIEIKSKLNKGTIVIIQLPILQNFS